MDSDREGVTSEPFAEIDRIVSGIGFAPDATSARTRAYQAALRSPAPLSVTIAASLLENRDARVALFTGFVVPGKYPAGENDGPLGTVALARALQQVGLRPTIRVDPEVLETTRWLLAELGAKIHVAAIESDPRILLDSIDIAIAIEKPGGNSLGILHTFDGERIDGGSKPIDRLFADLDRAGKMTIGVGDRGNEIGFGALREEIHALSPNTRTCSCGCGGGIAAATATRYLYPAAVSNWGAYGLVTALALLVGNPTITVQPDEERRMLMVAAVRGCCDGIRRQGTYAIDGLDGDVSVRLVSALNDLVRGHLRVEEQDACA